MGGWDVLRRIGFPGDEVGWDGLMKVKAPSQLRAARNGNEIDKDEMCVIKSTPDQLALMNAIRSSKWK